MKTKTTQIVTAIALTLAIAAFASFSPQNTQAEEVEPFIEITMGGPCTVFEVNAAGDLVGTGAGEEIVTVENGNHVILKCIAQGVTNDFGKTVVARGFMCRITLPGCSFVDTTDTHAVVTKSGISTLTCKFTY